MNPRKNNFDLLRLIFAGSVLLWHQYAISKQPALEIVSRVFSADLAVKGFFVVSGYLVVMSCEKSASVRDYASKRVRRICPAYFAVVLLCALAGFVLTSLPASKYLSAELARYLLANLAFLNFLAPTLPGVFAENPWREVNGALWTLKIEAMFYALVPLLVFGCRRLRAAPVIIALYAVSILYTLLMGELAQSTGQLIWTQLQRQLPGQLTFFLVGTAFYLYRQEAGRRWGLLLAIGAASLVVELVTAQPLARAALEPVWLGIAVVFAAFGVPYLGNFARFGDLSYGVYIIHFPVIQLAVAAGLFERAPWIGLAVTTTATVVLASLSWHLVEKPFLDRRSHYRLTEGARN